jgi:phage tail-like protein
MTFRLDRTRPFALVHTRDQWCRSAHEATAIERATGAVRLAGEPEPDSPPHDAPLPTPAGLAFDPWCRLFRSLPEEGRIERHLGATSDPLVAEVPPEPVDLFDPEVAPAGGDFTVEPAGALDLPRGLAIDGDGRLYVAETGAARLVVFDLVERRLLRRVVFPSGGGGGGFDRPLDVAVDGRTVWVALAGAAELARLTARGAPRRVALPVGVAPADRLAVRPADGSAEGSGGGEVYVLTAAGTAAARVVPFDRPADAWDVPFATDLEFESASVLVVARRPGEDFLRFHPERGEPDDHPRSKARGYDGRGIVRTPEGRIGFWALLSTGEGFRAAVLARVRYRRRGRVVTYRLDGGAFQMRWGRLFLDACIPPGTEVRVHAVAADQPPEGAPELPRTPPASGCPSEPLPGASPPMPAVSLLAPDDAHRPLHRRASGRELPWAPRPAGPLAAFETYEAPARVAPSEPGRYLWISLLLLGDGKTTPRVKSLRVEKPGHELLRRLPRGWSRDAAAADFLERWLAPLDGLLGELDGRASHRRALADPASAPPELLPWLASWMGLVLDERWPVAAKRRLIDELAWLWRFRGTLAGLERFLAIYLEAKKGAGLVPRIVEHWRVRGLGGAIVGVDGDGVLASQAVLGEGFRVGGAIGTEGEVALGEAGGAARDGGRDGFATHAHRFTVLVPARLDAEERAVLVHVLDEHRPAHTLFELCTTDAGLRPGVGLYLGLSSIVGRAAGFRPLELGAASLGTDRVLGRPGAGTRPGGSRAGHDAQVG